MYKLINNPETGTADTVQNKLTGVCIPMNEANRHYQEYLEWLAEGNTPEEAE
jgi:hypothetical protein